jgi:hypothetical protein
MKEPLLSPIAEHPWQNWHRTEGVGGKVARFYTPQNMWSDGTKEPKPHEFAPGLAALQKVVVDAEMAKKRVRAIGSGWSLSACGFTNDYLVNTQRLNWWTIGMDPISRLQPAYQAEADRVVFAQCGVQIKTLNNYLEQRRLALPTAGASNGQTIVGAMSTGTHGSANQVGGIQDYVLGLHVVGENGRHYWIERESKPVVTDEFLDWIRAKPKRNDDLFNSALVSFGSFGLIHAVMFKVEPVYVFERFVKQCDYSEVEHAIDTLEVSNLGLPHDDLPYHFEIVLNPYRLEKNRKGAFIRVLYKQSAGPQLPVPTVSQVESLRSKDLVSIAGLFSDFDAAVIPTFLQSQLEDSVLPEQDDPAIGTPGQMFSDSNPTGGGTSIEIGVALADARKAVDAILAVTAANPFGAPIALRYVKGSDALLAFTCFSPLTCTIELPGIDSHRARNAHKLIFETLREKGIRHTYHWGQALPLTPEWLRPGFGDDRVERWLAARRNFLSDAGRRMFANDQLTKLGLDT